MDRAVSGSVIGWEMKWDNNFDENIAKFKEMVEILQKIWSCNQLAKNAIILQKQ